MRIWLNRISYLCLILVFAGIFVIYQSFGVLVILGFLFVMPMLSALFCHVTYRRFRIHVETPADILEKEQEFRVNFVLENDSIFPVTCCEWKVCVKNGFMQEAQEFMMRCAVCGRGNETVKRLMSSRYCGLVQIQVKELRIYDYMHLFSRKIQCESNKDIILLPLVREGAEIDTNQYVSGSDDSEESHTKGSDFSQVSDVREYIPGDSLKDIHWKLSAKKDDLMVKEHVSMSSRQIALLIELYNDEDGYIDGTLEYAYSLGKYLVNRRQGFTFYWWSSLTGLMKEREILGEEDMTDCFREIFYEDAYDVMGTGLEQFRHMDYHMEHLVVVNNRERFSYTDVATS